MKLLAIVAIIFSIQFAYAEEPPAERAEAPAAQDAAGETPASGTAVTPPAGEAPARETVGAAGFFERLEERIGRAIGLGNYGISVLHRLGIAGGVVILQVILIWLVWIVFRRLTAKVRGYGERKFKPVIIKKFNLLSKDQILDGCSLLLRIIKYIVTAFQLFITVPIIFNLFETTREIARLLFGYITTPLKSIFFGVLGYVPNLITVAIILIVMRYVLRTLKYFASGLEKGKLKLTGFYPEWAQPTYNILRVLLYAFTIAVVYPYLPGSDSAVFQGISVFVGIIFSLGSSSAVGNLVAGLVITYMRPFKIGDRIKLGDITGFVVEKSPIVIRLRTHKNEYVTFPNMMVLSSTTVNYNTSQEKDEEGLILHADVTMNYVVPWPKMHEILIAAALKTPNTEKTPKPFVLQTALDDYYCRYEINVYTKDVGKVPSIYSDLHQNIQTGCAEAGIDLTAPAYMITAAK